MRVLITGSAGFIGHNLAIHLAEEGFETTALDNLERSMEFAVGRLRQHGIPIIKGNVKSLNNCNGFDVVIHAAAYASVPESMTKPIDYIENNVVGTARVVHECGNTGARLIYISSAAVYGNPIKLPIPEDHPINPQSSYGLSKYLGELVVRKLGETYGLRYVILRPFNAYGPGQNTTYAGVITSFIERAVPSHEHGDAQASLPRPTGKDHMSTRPLESINETTPAVKFLNEEPIRDTARPRLTSPRRLYSTALLRPGKIINKPSPLG